MSTDGVGKHWPWLALALGLALHGTALAAAAPEPPAEAQAAHQVTQPGGLAARLLGDQASPVRGLEPTIFTELSPVTTSQPPVRLPEDQRDED